MKKAIVIVSIMFLCVGGCQMHVYKDTREVQDAILRYNKLLSEGYAKMDMTPLREVTTEKQAQKVYHHMAALGEAKIKMESTLINIEFSDIQFPKKDLAQVKTKEKWDYTHVNIETKMPAQKVVQGLIYRLSYELVKIDGRWLVSSVTVLEEDMPEKVSQIDSSHLVTMIFIATYVTGSYSSKEKES